MTATPLKVGPLWFARCNPCGWEKAAMTGEAEARRRATDHNKTKHNPKEK